jgi:hypothetical protein
MSVVITKDPISGTMPGRGGFPVKTLIYATFILLLVYLFYIYSSAQSSLREAEMTASRYKREAEERVTEIQDLVRQKDRAQETCQNDKSENHNRIKSINQQYSLLQSQYKETEADFIKLRQDLDTMRTEHAQADSSHAAEYEKLKQEKDNEIAKLKDEVADLIRQSQNLENTITNLRLKVKESEVKYHSQSGLYEKLEHDFIALQGVNKQLTDQNALLQHQLHTKVVHQTATTQQQTEVVAPEGGLDKQLPQGQPNIQDQAANDLSNAGQPTFKPDAFLKDDVRPDVDDSLNQVRPPSNNNAEGGEDSKRGFSDVNLRPDVNPNDEQKAQILEPNLDQEKHQGGGEEGVVAMNVRQEEEARENNARQEEAEGLQHKNPLALGQIEVPKDLGDLENSLGENKKDGEQQAPPLLNEENDQKEQERGDYFGEDEDAQQQQQQQEERHQMEEEEEREEADDFDNNLDDKPNKAVDLADGDN